MSVEGFNLERLQAIEAREGAVEEVQEVWEEVYAGAGVMGG